MPGLQAQLVRLLHLRTWPANRRVHLTSALDRVRRVARSRRGSLAARRYGSLGASGRHCAVDVLVTLLPLAMEGCEPIHLSAPGTPDPQASVQAPATNRRTRACGRGRGLTLCIRASGRTRSAATEPYLAELRIATCSW